MRRMVRARVLVLIVVVASLMIVSHPAEATTAVLVKDIRPGPNGSSPDHGGNPFAVVNGSAFFSAFDGVKGGLWKSNGTGAGTTLVKDVFGPTDITDVNGTLYFRASNGVNGSELWKSDGSGAGTAMVKDITPGSTSSILFGLTNVGGTLFFAASNGVNGVELWKSDGTAAGTTMVKDINPGTASSTPNWLTEVNGNVFFAASDGTNGVELWKSDGTAGGTTMVADIIAGGGGSSLGELFDLNGVLYFDAGNPFGGNGVELWRSDGTAAGTTMVKDIAPGGSSIPRSLTELNGTLFFHASSTGTGSGIALWRSDGTAAGTTQVKATGHPFSPNPLTKSNGALYFRGDDGVNGVELWKSDGTAAGTTMVKDINPGSAWSFPSSLADVNGTLYFGANDGINGSELWKSDGTAAGTTLVRDIIPGSNSSGPSALTDLNGTLLFAATDASHGRELWRVGIVDTTAPVISVPSNLVVDATGPGGAFVTYATPLATDVIDGSVAVTCLPTSGNTFPIGTSAVNCSATDNSGNTGTGTFDITVNGAGAQIDNLTERVDNLGTSLSLERSLLAKLANAAEALEAGDTLTTCTKLRAFVNEVKAQSGKKISTVDAGGLIAAADRIRATAGCS